MISIVIPTYNEVKNIVPLLKKIISLINDINYEIIIVDDDSPDGTSEEINKYMSNNQRIKLITRLGRNGLSSAIKEGLIFAQGEHLLVLDGDGQHDPKFVLNMIDERKKSKSDLVIGSRFLSSSNLEGLSSRLKASNLIIFLISSFKFQRSPSCLKWFISI